MAMQSAVSAGPLRSASMESVLRAARTKAGLDDFGSMSFTTGLNILLTALQREAELNEIGEQMNYDGIIRRLVNRLRYQDDLKKHPEILNEKILAPIIILGLPRTGTSKLQRVLSASPKAQRLDFWRLNNPAPFPNEEFGNPAARIAQAVEEEKLMATAFPDFMARHPMEATEPDEELHLMDMSFDSYLPWVFADIPSYYQHMQHCDAQPMYKELYAMLQYLQWQDGGAGARHWVLKTPVHLGQLPALLHTFPDANLIHCHRDPVDVIPSFASMIAEARRIGCKQIDEHQIGREQLKHWSTEMEKYLLDREKMASNRILDVDYKDIVSDVFSVIEKIYVHSNLALEDEAMQAFDNYETRRPKGHWGNYSYTPEQYGLTADDINTQTESYQQRYLQK